MITSLNEFKIYENKKTRFEVIQDFQERNYKIILNGSDKLLNIVNFKVGHIVTYTMQSGSLGNIVELKNETTNEVAEFWSDDFSFKKRIRKIEEAPIEPKEEKEDLRDENDIHGLYSHNTYWTLFEYFSELLVSTLPNNINYAYEILKIDDTLVFNIFDSEEKTRNSKIILKKIVDISSADGNENKIVDIVFKELEDYWNKNHK